MLNREQIERRVPHSAAMCLLDSVLAWDEANIHCQARAPDAAHPLARAQRVPAVAALEYAAQAAAVHGALLEPADAPRAGLLAMLGEVDLPASELDPQGGALEIRAELLSRNPAGCLYAFEVRDQRACVARGRLMVAFPP